MKKTLTVLMMVLLAAMLIISCDSSTSEPKTETPTTTPSEPTPTPMKKTYTVTFVTGDGGSTVASQSIEDGKTATKPADPTRTGYVFVRWSATENGEKAFDFTNTIITANTTIYAVWAKVYKIGDEGPAGGIILYDCDADNTTDGGAGADGLKSSDCGWRYLEAAPADLTTTYTWGPSGSSYSTETGIGKGKSNTDKLLAASGDFPAAEACDAYSKGGYDDWFLPSKDELNLMYTYSKSEGKGGTWQSTSSYWSSSESGSDSAWYQSFSSGEQNGSNRYVYPKSVRPIRAFK